MIEPRFEKIPLSQCMAMAHQKNPKDHDVDALIASFARFGFKAYPSIDEATQVMVSGHGRCEALSRLRSEGKSPPIGISEVGTEWMVPVIRGLSFSSESERDAWVLADNQHVMAGGWHFDLLADMLHDLKDGDGLDGLGFETVEIDSILGNYVAESADDGVDPEDKSTDGPRTMITATVECPSCGHMFER